MSADTIRVLDGGERFIVPSQDFPDPLHQSVVLRITNPGGAQIQHQVFSVSDNQSSTNNYMTKMGAVSTTPQNTPLLAAGVGFTTGFGVLAANPEYLIFDTLPQGEDDASGVAVIEFNNTGTANIVPRLRVDNSNIGGVTRPRFCVALSIDGTGAAFPINVANVPAGKILHVRIDAQVR